MKSQNITFADEMDDIFQPRKKANLPKQVTRENAGIAFSLCT